MKKNVKVRRQEWKEEESRSRSKKEAKMAVRRKKWDKVKAEIEIRRQK